MNLVFYSLVGSHNYNLNTKNSDKDYKYFVMPTFDDLYYNKYIHKEFVSKDIDYTVHDIRKLPVLFYKSNINFLEVLFSIDSNCELKFNDFYKWLIINREKLATMNLQYLYKACIGMYFTKRKQMINDSDGRHLSIEKYGYDTKSACHSYRVLDFLIRMYQNDFCFGDSIYYDDCEKQRNLLIRIKSGEYNLYYINEMLNKLKENVDSLESYFVSQNSNVCLYEELQDRVKNIVMNFLLDK